MLSMNLENIVKNVQALETANERMKGRIEDLTQEMEKLTRSGETLEAENATLRNVDQKYKDAMQDLTDHKVKLEHDVTELRSHYEENQDARRKLANDNKHLTNENQKLQDENEQLIQRVDKLTDEKEELVHENEELEESNAALHESAEQSRIAAQEKDDKHDRFRLNVASHFKLDDELRSWARDCRTTSYSPSLLPGDDSEISLTQSLAATGQHVRADNEISQASDANTISATRKSKKLLQPKRYHESLRKRIKGLSRIEPNEDIRNVLRLEHRPACGTSEDGLQDKKPYRGERRVIKSFDEWPQSFVIPLRKLVAETGHMSRQQFYRLVEDAVEQRRRDRIPPYYQVQELLPMDCEDLSKSMKDANRKQRQERDVDSSDDVPVRKRRRSARLS